MADRVEAQRKSIQNLIDGIYDIPVKKDELPASLLTDENYATYLKLLQKLPPFISKHFSVPVSRLLQNDVKNAYRVIWWGIYLKNIYRGVELKVTLPDSWEDDCDLYVGCQELLQELLDDLE